MGHGRQGEAAPFSAPPALHRRGPAGAWREHSHPRPLRPKSARVRHTTPQGGACFASSRAARRSNSPRVLGLQSGTSGRAGGCLRGQGGGSLPSSCGEKAAKRARTAQGKAPPQPAHCAREFVLLPRGWLQQRRPPCRPSNEGCATRRICMQRYPLLQGARRARARRGAHAGGRASRKKDIRETHLHDLPRGALDGVAGQCRAVAGRRQGVRDAPPTAHTARGAHRPRKRAARREARHESQC